MLIAVPPEAARQTREGYWMGAIPGRGSLPFFKDKGITLVLSAVSTLEDVSRYLAEEGIRQVKVPMGTTFRHAETILETTAGMPPEQCFLHCHYGADRTGCMVAFLLCVRHGWSIPDAFYSVLYKSPRDTRALGNLLQTLGIEDRRTTDDPSVSFYSHAACGLVGGLKARAPGYQNLIRTTIQSIRKHHGKDQLQALRQGP